jgi:hypothetical protein
MCVFDTLIKYLMIIAHVFFFVTAYSDNLTKIDKQKLFILINAFLLKIS